MKTVSLALMRTQPIHMGHCKIVDEMINNSDVTIIGAGSADKPVTDYNPFPITVRIQMWKELYGDKIKIVPLSDLGTTKGTDDWCDYVLNKINGLGLPHPTDYWTGSLADAIWYRGRFFGQAVGSPADDNPEDFVKRYMPNGRLRQLHLVDREYNDIPSATELRQFLIMGDSRWKKWIPEEIHHLVLEHFPVEFKVLQG